MYELKEENKYVDVFPSFIFGAENLNYVVGGMNVCRKVRLTLGDLFYYIFR